MAGTLVLVGQGGRPMVAYIWCYLFCSGNQTGPGNAFAGRPMAQYGKAQCRGRACCAAIAFFCGQKQ